MIKNNEHSKLLKTNKNSKNMLEWKHKQTTKQCHNILKELMHGHVLMFMHVYPSSSTRHVRLGWYLERIGYMNYDFQTLGWSLPKKMWWCLSSSSRLQYQTQLLSLLIAWDSPCHFFVLLAFESCHSSMPKACGN